MNNTTISVGPYVSLEGRFMSPLEHTRMICGHDNAHVTIWKVKHSPLNEAILLICKNFSNAESGCFSIKEIGEVQWLADINVNTSIDKSSIHVENDFTKTIDKEIAAKQVFEKAKDAFPSLIQLCTIAIKAIDINLVLGCEGYPEDLKNLFRI
ncbi:MAG: hypothetical protein H0U49_11025 [Parachlamydiaceae bacterium]|nr:hypothetical protein [Parachlamydiaceae bacterium]